MNSNREHIDDASSVDTGGGFRAWLTAPPRRRGLRKPEVLGLAGIALALVSIFMQGPSAPVFWPALTLGVSTIMLVWADWLPVYAVRAAAWLRGVGVVLSAISAVALLVALPATVTS